VVSTPAGAVQDIIENGENGILANGFSEESLYQAVLKFLSLGSKIINKIRNNNRIKFYNQYSMEICANRYLNLYKRKISEKKW